MADAHTAAGFLVIAPALFDRVERNVQLAYEGEDMQRAVALQKQLDAKIAHLDIALLW